MTKKLRTTDAMPDQLTCLLTPRDQNGDAMVPDRQYMVRGKRVQCFEGGDGTLMAQEAYRLGVAVPGSRPQSVSELPADVTVTLVDE